MAVKTEKIMADTDAEEAVIGDLLIDPGCFPRLKAIIAEQDFYIHKYRWIWEAFSNLSDSGSPIDIRIIVSELEQIGKLKEIGGESFLEELINRTPTSLHAEAHAQIVKDWAIRRGYLAGASDLANWVTNREISLEQITERFARIAQEATGKAQRRYIVRDAAYALEPQPPVKYLVEGLIYEKSITVLYGDGGTKKTWSSLYLGACVASGQTWGEFSTQRTRVLFVDEENGESEMKIRTGFCIRGALTDATAELHFTSLAAFHLDNTQDEAILTNEILAQGAGLVIFDALADLMTGDENSKQFTQPVFNALRRIAEKTGAAILVIHHANKQGGYRGTSVIKDAPDILIQVESEEDSSFVNFKIEKNRKGKSLRWAMHATWTEDSFYLSIAEKQEKPLGKGEDFVLNFLKENGASEKDAICGSATDCSAETARRAIYSLLDKEKIYRTNPDKNFKIKAIYDLTSAV